MKNYIINKNTCAVLPSYKGSTMMSLKGTSEFLVPTKIVISDSCKHYGSSLEGRLCGTKYLTGLSYKSPIMLSELNDIVMLPTASIRSDDCVWLSLYNIDGYYPEKDKKVKVIFINGEELIINVSYGIFDKQVLRANRLATLFKHRK